MLDNLGDGRAAAHAMAAGAIWRAGARALLVIAVVASHAAMAADAPPSSDLPDLSAIRARIYSGEYEQAVSELLPLATSVHHADLYNLLGFSYRKLKKYDEASRWYKEALYYDPTHRPALEYQGELFLDIGDLERARKNLETLRLVCYPTGCEEYDKLNGAIDRASAKLER